MYDFGETLRTFIALTLLMLIIFGSYVGGSLFLSVLA